MGSASKMMIGKFFSEVEQLAKSEAGDLRNLMDVYVSVLAPVITPDDKGTASCRLVIARGAI